MSLTEKLKIYQSRVERALDKSLPGAEQEPSTLHQAMRYAVLGSGKRIRPVLVYACGETLGVSLDILDTPAVAVELIHAYSLIHDDLPAMDNDDLRRGKPTCHRAFDEATAILAGDAIQALAFQVLAGDNGNGLSNGQRIRMIDVLATASGSRGMAGGQAIDLAAVGKALSLAELENMHNHKTGALIRASIELGALCHPHIQQDEINRLSAYARDIGLAFQVQDDILDIEAETEVMGKPQGSDIERNKPTYPNLLGLDGAKRIAAELHTRALASLVEFGDDAEILRQIADYIIKRKN